MGNLKFGPWLLEQQERGDTTGALARAWRALKDARGYNRHTSVKAIRELLSSSLGEDWQALRGDESITAAEAEWKASGNPAQTTGVMVASGGSIDYSQEHLNTGMLAPDQRAVPAAPMAVLWFEGNRYELTPGKTYTLLLGHDHVMRVGEPEQEPIRTQNYAVQEAAADAMLADGRTNWAALYAMADHNVPDGMEIVDTGWAE